MCGIAGAFFGLTKLQMEQCAKDICTEIKYRGPDGQGVEYFENGFLLHLRLAIIDLSEGGKQPKWSDDRRYCITYNGEIYNYIELREELRRQGCVFNTESDTEVLLQLWAKHGPAGLAKCVGMYAFALLDTVDQTIHFARDIYGIKPLYVMETETGLRFGSSYAALSHFPDCSKNVDPSMAYGFVRYGTVERDGRTLVKDVRSLGLGAVETWSLRGTKPKLISTFQVPIPKYKVTRDKISFRDAAQQLREAFLQSVRLHLRSDVPLGFALSGGLDSSAIVCASRILEPDAELNTFTYSAEGHAFDEQSWASIVSRHVKAIPHTVHLSSIDALKYFEDSVRYYGPSSYAGLAAQAGVFRTAHENGITVMLDGQGADELFGGYGFHVGAALAGYIRRGEFGRAWILFNRARKNPNLPGLSSAAWAMEHLLPQGLQSLGRQVIGKSQVPRWLNSKWLNERAPEAVSDQAILASNFGRDVLADRLELDLTRVILPELLQIEDRNSMFYSVESRVPFLSSLMSDIAFSVPSSFHVGPDGQTKSLLREALRGIVPDEIRMRKDKIGLVVPQGHLLFDQREQIDEILRSACFSGVAIFDWEKLLDVWRRIDSPAHPDFKFVWRWVALVVWTKEFQIAWN